MSQTYDVAIVGAGVMGISIAYHLSRRPESVIVIDKPSPGAASSDLNKIVRRDYTDSFYMNKMGTSFSGWDDPLFHGLVHKSGRVVRCGESQFRSIKENRKALGLPDLEELSPQDAAQKLKNLIRCPIREGTSTFFNAEDLWIELPPCLKRMVNYAEENKVVFQSNKVIELIIDQTNGRCEGVRTEQGTVVHARTVIIATGAWTQELLGDTPILPDLRGLPVATGVIVAHFNLSSGEMERFGSLPIFSDIEDPGEILPPTNDGILKVTLVKSFTNKGSSQGMSVPKEPPEPIPEALKKEIRQFVESLCPTLSGETCEFKIYWDGITNFQDPILDYHPHHANVILSVGGSFHMAKFLPCWGKYVIDMIDGKLEKGCTSKWSFLETSHTGRKSNQPRLQASRDWEDLL